jgi:hypothetical protein
MKTYALINFQFISGFTVKYSWRMLFQITRKNKFTFDLKRFVYSSEDLDKNGNSERLSRFPDGPSFELAFDDNQNLLGYRWIAECEGENGESIYIKTEPCNRVIIDSYNDPYITVSKFNNDIDAILWAKLQ